jgi:hypothetical protein
MAKPTSPIPNPTDQMKQMFDWYQYCWQWWEMMTAASMTIGLRTTGMSYKMRKNQVPDYAEAWRMVAEKNEALLKSMAAMAPWQNAAGKYWTQALAGQTSETGRDMTSNLLDQQFQFGKLMLQSLTTTMKPFHKATTGNAFRLSGTRKPRKA